MVAILFQRNNRWHVPFVVRQAGLSSHPGQVGLPGGGLQPGETAWLAAARESEEEIGVSAAALLPLGAAPPVYAAVSNNSVVAFIAWLPESDPVFRPDEREVAHVLEVPLEVLVDEAAWLDSPEPWPGRHLPVVDTVIWGLTARMLGELLPAIAAALD